MSRCAPGRHRVHPHDRCRLVRRDTALTAGSRIRVRASPTPLVSAPAAPRRLRGGHRSVRSAGRAGVPALDRRPLATTPPDHKAAVAFPRHPSNGIVAAAVPTRPVVIDCASSPPVEVCRLGTSRRWRTTISPRTGTRRFDRTSTPASTGHGGRQRSSRRGCGWSATELGASGIRFADADNVARGPGSRSVVPCGCLCAFRPSGNSGRVGCGSFRRPDKRGGVCIPKDRFMLSALAPRWSPILGLGLAWTPDVSLSGRSSLPVRYC